MPSSRILTDLIVEKANNKARTIVAIAGPPASGKSTLAETLCRDLKACDVSAAIIPMDGFHLDNRILDERGLRHRKGAPQTFDADGFVHLIRRLSNEIADVVIPVFDRERDIAVAGASVVTTDDRVLLVEGNYLLLTQHPWSELADLFDLSLFLDPGPKVLERRLIERWTTHGHDTAAAGTRARENDLPNARLVVEQSRGADIHLGTKEAS